MKSIIQILLVASLYLLSAFNSYAQEKISGAEVINNNCARCHNARAVHEFSIPEWKVVIPHMRVKAHLTGKEAQAVLEFLELTSQSVVLVKKVEPENVIALDGKQLFTQFGCQGCHSFKGDGGTAGPALDGVVKNKGIDFFINKLQNPLFNNSSSPMPKMPLNEQQINAIAEYIK
ncbi:c-type cytochrome [Pseudoalteromonas phenolica]|uniref:c-type cytochrome n=1 Tax=Pseudoalteromonas phenolica TaxID=161398 RepID=UPI00384B0B17